MSYITVEEVLHMKRTLITSVLSIIVLVFCAFVFFACTPEELSVSIVITDVERGIESGALYIDGYSVSDKKEFRFQFKDYVASGDEPLIANVVEIIYMAKNENEEAIPIERINVLSNEVFSGRMVFIKELGACFISSANNAYQLNQIKGLNAAYYNNLKLADSVVVYGDIISDEKDSIIIGATHLEVARDDEVRAWNDAELAILEKYDIADSYAQMQNETPPGDRNPSDPEIVNLLALTDAKVKEEYGIGDLDDYSVSIHEHVSKPKKTVRYRLYLFGYRTYEEYVVSIDDNGTILDCYAANAGDYSRFLPYLKIEKLQEAEEKLKNKMAKYDNSSSMYLGINSKGQLCLIFEAIVDINPFKGQAVDGEMINSGCNIDHRHVFESEVVCDINQ